jgi:hypothetical protein
MIGPPIVDVKVPIAMSGIGSRGYIGNEVRPFAAYIDG